MQNQKIRILSLAGWQNSPDGHWQTIFEAKYSAKRVQQKNWMHPDADSWVEELEKEVVAAQTKNLVIIAHSLGCTTLAKWASKSKNTNKVLGAFIVAPPDINRSDMPEEIVGFRPEVEQELPFPSIVIGTDSDPYCSLERLSEITRLWGSKFVQSESHGHINVESGQGPWPEGEKLLSYFLSEL